MGFRSTFVTDDVWVRWPDWFRTRYDGAIFFSSGRSGVIASKSEAKTYSRWETLSEDIQRVLCEDADPNAPRRIVLIYLHECGGITRVQIDRERILYSEPESWGQTDGVEHDYCYGCSDVERWT